MSSQSKINAYMERHRLGPLFEDLMNKVLRDMPEEPMVYLLRSMYKKAGMEIPQGIRYGGLRKSTTDFSRSPERPSRSAQMSRSADLSGVAGSRDYSKPWATSPSRKMKVRKSEDASASSKQKPDWNPDNKTKPSVFDEFWEQGDASGKDCKDKTTMAKKSTAKQTSTPASAWASVGVLDQDEVYTSPSHPSVQRGRVANRMSEQELLAMENIKPSLRCSREEEQAGISLVSSKQHIRGPRLEAKKHRQQLAQALKEADGSSDDSGVGVDAGGLEDSDAIELLEDADDLVREGVRNPPKSGYKLSKAMRHRKNEPRVKLSLNTYAYPRDPYSHQDYRNPPSPQSSPDRGLSDEDFESVSQVTGPRQPVWKVPEEDFPPPEPSYSRQTPLTSSKQRKSYTEKSLAMTSPAPFQPRTVSNMTDLDTQTKSWTAGEARVSFEDRPPSRPDSSRSFQSQTSGSGGWLVPDDTEVASALDWNRRVKGSSKRQDPRSY